MPTHRFPPRRHAALHGRQYRLARFADVDGVLDVERPFAARPPDDSSRLQVVAGQDTHAISFRELATPGGPGQSSASARAATLRSAERRVGKAGVSTFRSRW